MPDNVIYFQLITPVIYVFPAVLPTVATVIFFTSFSGACRLIIEDISNLSREADECAK